MEYRIDGEIKFSPITQLGFDSPVEFTSPSGANITLDSKSYEGLSVSITLEAGDKTAVKDLAQIELSRICGLLSFFHNISISKSRITGMIFERVTSEGKHIRTGEATVELDVILSDVKDFSEKDLKKLVCDMEQEYSLEFEEVILLWRAAISKEAPTEKYFFLYRLMESLFKENTRELTAWIRSKETSVHNYMCPVRKYEITIYTHLRDHIHPNPGKPKSGALPKAFPLRELRENLLKFQDLVQEAIKEKYNIK